MRPQHAGHFLHGLDPAAHDSRAPVIEKAPGIPDRTIAPELLEGLLEAPGSTGGHFAGQERFKFLLRLTPHPGSSAKKFPTHLFELLSGGLTPKPGAFGPAHLIDGLIKVQGDVETVDHMQGLGGALGDDGQVRFPHVTTDEAQGAHHFRTQCVESLAEGGLGSPGADPEQTATTGVDLVDDGQEVGGPLALAPMDFVDANGLDVGQLAMGQPPFDGPFDGAIDRLPAGAEDAGGIPPGEASSPGGEEAHHGDGDRALAMAPGDKLDDHTVLGTLDPAGGEEEEDGDGPQGHKGPSPLGQTVISRTGLATGGALGPDAGMGLDRNLNELAARFADQLDVAEDEAGETLNPVQDLLNFESDGWPPWLSLTPDWKPNRTTEGQPSFCPSASGLFAREERIYALGASRRIGQCRSATRAPGRPWNAWKHPIPGRVMPWPGMPAHSMAQSEKLTPPLGSAPAEPPFPPSFYPQILLQTRFSPPSISTLRTDPLNHLDTRIQSALPRLSMSISSPL